MQIGSRCRGCWKRRKRPGTAEPGETQFAVSPQVPMHRFHLRNNLIPATGPQLTANTAPVAHIPPQARLPPVGSISQREAHIEWRYDAARQLQQWQRAIAAGAGAIAGACRGAAQRRASSLCQRGAGAAGVPFLRAHAQGRMRARVQGGGQEQQHRLDQQCPTQRGWGSDRPLRRPSLTLLHAAASGLHGVRRAGGEERRRVLCMPELCELRQLRPG